MELAGAALHGCPVGADDRTRAAGPAHEDGWSQVTAVSVDARMHDEQEVRVGRSCGVTRVTRVPLSPVGRRTCGTTTSHACTSHATAAVSHGQHDADEVVSHTSRSPLVRSLVLVLSVARAMVAR